MRQHLIRNGIFAVHNNYESWQFEIRWSNPFYEVHLIQQYLRMNQKNFGFCTVTYFSSLHKWHLSLDYLKTRGETFYECNILLQKVFLNNKVKLLSSAALLLWSIIFSSHFFWFFIFFQVNKLERLDEYDPFWWKKEILQKWDEYQ